MTEAGYAAEYQPVVLSGVTELLVHGVGGESPAHTLGEPHPVQVAGDGTAGFHRGPDVERRHRQAYSWGGLTSGTASRARWVLLLPFALANWPAGWTGVTLRPGAAVGPPPDPPVRSQTAITPEQTVRPAIQANEDQEDSMPTASEFLASIVAQPHAPSITLATLQRHLAPAGATNRWAPGIGSYGWGINGSVVNDPGGARTALRFGVEVWFSDRRTNPSASPPSWQQFSAQAKDRQRITLEPAGPQVTVTIVLLSWGNATSATSFAFEPSSQQLLFTVPGAGPGAPPAIMVVALHPTGRFGFL